MSTLDEVGDGEVKITNGAGVQLTLKADAVVNAIDMVPNTTLADELSDEFDVKCVGDCADPWDIQAAIATANLAARASLKTTRKEEGWPSVSPNSRRLAGGRANAAFPLYWR